MKKTVKVLNETGLHARPASIFVKIASSYKSGVTIEANGKEGNGKSILSVLGMGIQCGTDLTITTDGPDEADALAELCGIIENKFGEA